MKLPAILGSIALAACSQATALWDQPWDGFSPGIQSQVYPDSPAFSAVCSDDFVVGNEYGWLVNNVIVYGIETGDPSKNLDVVLGFGYTPNFNDVVLSLHGQQVGHDLLFHNIHLSINGPGPYWMFAYVVRPVGTGGNWLWKRTAATANEKEHYFHNPGGGHGFGKDPVPGSVVMGSRADLAFRMEGEGYIPEPGTMAALILGGLGLLRRRIGAQPDL